MPLTPTMVKCEQLLEARRAAHAAYEAQRFKRSNACAATAATSTSACTSSTSRVKNAGLREALMLHACRYAAARATEQLISRNRRKRAGYVLGNGTSPRREAFWKIRAERVHIVMLEAALASAARTTEAIEEEIKQPRWLNIRYIAVLRAMSARNAVKQDCKPVAIVAAAPTAKPMFLTKSAPLGYAEYIARASAARAAGALGPTYRVSCIEEKERLAIFRRYAGLPDEMYRRHSGRRYGKWRRMNANTIAKVEAEMVRRRGADRLEAGTVGASRYVYDGGEHVYAFSCRITAAPRLRATMVRKYSTREATTLEPRPDAKQLASKTPMFHTRVMNRFL